MNALRAMYGLRRVGLPVTTILLSASTIHLLNLPSESSAAHLGQAMNDLQAMSVNHRFAAKCVDIIRALATKWSITLPDGAAPGSVYRDTAHLCGPSPTSSTFFAASIPREQSSESGTRSGDSMTSQGPFLPPNHAATQQQQQQKLQNQQQHEQHHHNQQQQQQHQQQHHFPTYYNDSTTQLDAAQAQVAFWTPFPLQGAPITSQWDTGMFDFNATAVSATQQWPAFEGHAGAASCGPEANHMPPARIDEGIDGGMMNWHHWQQ